jgi:hypothetical protein
MSKVIILLFVLLSRLAIDTDAANPVSKFLKNRGGGGGGGGDDAELVATKASLAEHVKAAKVTSEQALGVQGCIRHIGRVCRKIWKIEEATVRINRYKSSDRRESQYRASRCTTLKK